MGCDKLRWPRFGIRRKDWEREMGWGGLWQAGGAGEGGGWGLWLKVVAGGNWRGGMEGAIKCLILYFLSVSSI